MQSSWLTGRRVGQAAAVIATIALTCGQLIVAGPQTGFKTGVSSVPVYATVRDASGRLVPDLTRDKFQVLDNGQRAEITLFSHERQPITAVVMLDTSASMLTRFARVRDSTQSFISALQAEDRIQIGSFGEEIAVSPVLTGDKSILRRIVREELWPRGETPLWTAIDAAMSALTGEKGRRVVMILTEGRDACTLAVCLTFQEILDRAVHDGYLIYAIGLSGSGLAKEAIQLAEETGGGHFELKTDADLTPTFERVAEELRWQYVLGFAPARLDGKLHQVQVRVTEPGMQVRARKNYLAEVAR